MSEVRVGLVAEADTRELRRSVLRPELPPGKPLPGDDLQGGVHVGATAPGGEVVATCFIYPDPCYWRADGADAWHLRQMATAERWRGRGVGGRVLAAAVALAEQRGAPILWCHAREGAVRFYARHGFEPHGEIFTDARHVIPHLRMSRTLSSG